MAADFFGDLEPSLQALLAQAGSGGGEAESVVGYSSLPQDAAAAAATVDVGESTSTGSCNSVVGANCTAAAGEGLQADASVAEASDVCERTIVSGWKKRWCMGGNYNPAAPPERPLNSTHGTALERTLRDFPARSNGEVVIVPEVGVTFDSIGEAYDFYNLYSWERGFGVRYGKSRLNVDQVKCMQEIVCGCSVSTFSSATTPVKRYEGKPRVMNSQSTRCLCPALVRLLCSIDASALLLSVTVFKKTMTLELGTSS